jgi:hypothetical protein
MGAAFLGSGVEVLSLAVVVLQHGVEQNGEKCSIWMLLTRTTILENIVYFSSTKIMAYRTKIRKV